MKLCLEKSTYRLDYPKLAHFDNALRRDIGRSTGEYAGQGEQGGIYG
jgi:hypothetical protein